MRKLIYISLMIVVCVTAFAANRTASAAPYRVDFTNLFLSNSATDYDPNSNEYSLYPVR